MSHRKYTIQQEIKRKMLKEIHGQTEVSFETSKIKALKIFCLRTAAKITQQVSQS